MTNDELDEKVLAAIRNSPRHLKDSEIIGTVFPTRVDGDIELIDASVERLLSRKLIKDTSEENDWHPHYSAVNPLEVLARISKKRRRR